MTNIGYAFCFSLQRAVYYLYYVTMELLVRGVFHIASQSVLHRRHYHHRMEFTKESVFYRNPNLFFIFRKRYLKSLFQSSFTEMCFHDNYDNLGSHSTTQIYQNISSNVIIFLLTRLINVKFNLK